MTFAQKMMAKMGHIEGQGLGKDNVCITEPVKALTISKGAGLGSEALHCPVEDTKPEVEPGWERITSSHTVQISNFDGGADPAYVFRLFKRDASKVKEIWMGGHSCQGQGAVVQFYNEEDADDAVEALHETQQGPNGRKIRVELVGDDVAPPEGTSLLSSFLEEQENNIITSTVLITDFPWEHTRRKVNEFIKDQFGEDALYEIDTGEGDIDFVWCPEAGFGEAYIRFKSTAEWFVDEWNGNYWRNETLYVKYVSDEELRDIEEERAVKKGAGPSARLVVRNFPPDVTTEYIRLAFQLHTVNDIQFPPNKKSAFVFMSRDDGDQILKKYQNGYRLQGRMLFVEEMMKGKGKGKNKRPTGSMGGLVEKTAALSLKTVDLKLNKVPFNATEQDMRTFFNRFQLRKIVMKEGYAFVGMDGEQEAQRAVQQLNRKKMLGRAVDVKLAGPRK
jgi:RNA recognition motif-containing protein